MFEVIATFRPNFTEKIVGRYPSGEEAQAAAQRYWVRQQARVIRAWVRQVRESKTNS